MIDVFHIAIKLANINVVNVLVKILKQKSTQKYITDLNTKVQLFDQGEDSRGIQLSAVGGSYSPTTIRIKARKNQPSNRVTLKDTGDFYKSFEVLVKPNADFSIDSDPIKEGVSLFKRWGDDVEGLQDENIELVMTYLEDKFFKELYKGL